MRKALNIFAVLLVIASLAGMMGFASRQRHQVVCKDIQVKLTNSDKWHFLEEDAIKEMLKDMGAPVLQQPVNEIPLAMLENKLRNNPYVKRADLYITLDGHLEAKVTQREPIARIMAGPGRSYYLDRDGVFMPPSPHYAAHVPVINGYLRIPYLAGSSVMEHAVPTSDSIVLRDLYRLVQFIHGDAFWQAQIEQIYVNERKDIELIPRVGDHRIILGSVDQMEDKFSKLRIFYTEGLNHTDWNLYSTINLKYKNQIICTKR